MSATYSALADDIDTIDVELHVIEWDLKLNMYPKVLCQSLIDLDLSLSMHADNSYLEVQIDSIL